MVEKQFTFIKDTVVPNLKTPIVFNNETMSIGEVLDKLNGFADENEQLQNQIDELEDDNEKYSKSLDKLEDYTKRFIPTKCLNEFKDCKTNRYYWLDHEGNFEGALELLNLMDCENEQLKQRNDRQAKQLDRLYSLVEEKDWTALSDIIDDFKRCEEQLQREWVCYE